MANWTNEQLDAINKEGTNIIVSAGAGSGKTAVLTERVLRKLKSGVSINELLILTFTKAAANEMKERIRKNIKKNPDLIGELDKIDSAYITTFDSYALSIVKKYHYLLGVSSNVSIIEQSLIDLKKKEIMEHIFEDYYKCENALFLKLINDFCTKDDNDIMSSILLINNKLDLKYDKKTYLENYLANYYNDNKINSDISSYLEIIKINIENIKNELKTLEEYVENEYIIKLLDVLNPLFESTIYEEFKTNIKVKLPMLPRGSEEEAKKIKENISNIIKETTKLLEYESENEILNDIMSTRNYAEIITQIILKFDEELNKYKFDNDAYEFNDIAKMAIKVLKENSGIAEELKNSLNEILVDEYQDTSDLQETFLNLIENNNLYMVGDIKQSIYRFRNANPYIFKNKYDKYKEQNGGIKIDLNKNFRSREEPLHNINEIFNLVMDDKIGGADYKDTHQMVYGNLTYQNEGATSQNNNLEIYEYEHDKDSKFSKEEIEIFMIAKDIKDKVDSKYQVFDKDELILRDITYKDFVILMDRTTNFNLYKKIFEYLGIPLTIHKDESVTNNQNIMIIKNILTLIINWKDKNIAEEFKYAFVSIARSYLFRYSDDEIFNFIKDVNYAESSIIKLVEEIIGYLKNSSNINILELIIDKFNFYEKMIEIGDVNETIIVLEYILKLSDNLSNINYDIYAFLEYLKNICNQKYDIKFSLNKETGDSVNIMTIHKSKGLEYHICYFPGLYAKFNISDVKERFTFDNKYGFILPTNNNGIGDTIYKYLLKDSYIKEEISEKIRLFYVALTRAKEKMIMIRKVSDKNVCEIEKGIVSNGIRYKYMSFDNIISSVRDELDKYINFVDLESLGLTKDYNYIKEIDFKQNIDNSNDKILVNKLEVCEDLVENETFSKHNYEVISKKEYENMGFGKKIHQILEYMDFNNPCFDNMDNFCKHKIKLFLNSDLFKDKIINAYHEYEFMNIIDDKVYHGIIDLILETEDTIKIVDFKLKNISDEAYFKQLTGYKNYISELTSKEVKIYLYSIIDGTLTEIV